ncbi:hypothetical protein LTR94_026704, partial [Friedmanniomyces endolithicus]
MASIRHAGDAIAHDLRSPLTRMRAKLEVALIDAEAGRIDGVDALGVALDEADHLLKTFNTVLAIARLQAGGAPDPQMMDAADLAADMAELYEPAAEDKSIDFSSEIEKGLMIEGNQPFLAQALANIIDNAIKYTPAGGAVKLRARRRSSGEIEYSVTDTGPGVPEADRERVVQRFVRLDNSRTEAGSGLGLSLVTAVAEAHGGRVVLDEGPGAYQGSGPGLRAMTVSSPAPLFERLVPAGPIINEAACERVRDSLQAAAEQEGWVETLERVWPALAPVAAASPYLAGLMRRRPQNLYRLLSADPDAGLQQILKDTDALDAEPDEVRSPLRVLKADLHLLTALADLGGVWDLDQVTLALSRFADASCRAALRSVAREQRARGRLVSPPTDPRGPIPGLFGLAMGKHGANELNYSSDIDISLFFEPRLTVLALADGVE